VISDLKTRKVLWVSESCSKKGLDEFFVLIGADACKKIEVVTVDQHDPYKASIEEHCPQAVIVWDRFHLMQSFSEAVNETRKELFEFLSKHDSEIARLQGLLGGKTDLSFLKKIQDVPTLSEL
jgi:transposase